MDLTRIVHHYHDATKHHFNRFARSLGYLDWATQPNPFRRYEGAPLVELWRGLPDWSAYDDLFTPAPSRSGRPSDLPLPPVTLERVSLLLRYSMGLSAWKQYGPSRWALRVNPSSGNLHPTESYVVTRSLDVVDGGGTGVYHYAPDAHVLERRLAHGRGAFDALGLSSSDTVIVGLTTIQWREAWKYGERAFRYCQHDTGHAIAAFALAARMLGWEARVSPSVSMSTIASMLGLDRDGDYVDAEREEPQCLLIVGPPPAADARVPPLDVGRVFRPGISGEWEGTANQLSRERIDWPIIDEVAEATRAPVVTDAEGERACRADLSAVALAKADAEAQGGARRADLSAVALAKADAAQIILQRRSALAFDGVSRLDRGAFVRMLARVLPADAPPWSALWWPARIHLAIFVHRVEGVAPGLYFFIRNPASEGFIRDELQREFSWTRVPGVPDALPLFCLAEGDCRRLAARVSCDQEIASDGFFSLGMIAEFDPALETHGPWFYRQLFWESGVVGQVLYLEAEAAGARSTGIGCFYDEPVHETLGIFSHRLQSLYHFTVGMPVEDPRLTTAPGYGWESER